MRKGFGGGAEAETGAEVVAGFWWCWLLVTVGGIDGRDGGVDAVRAVRGGVGMVVDFDDSI